MYENEIYIMGMIILILSLIIVYKFENLYLLGVIGHTFLFARYLFPFDKNKIYLLFGHFLLIIGFGLRLDNKYHGHIIPSMIGSVAHSLFFANFLKNIFGLDNKNLIPSKFKSSLYILTGLANVCLSVLYYITYSKKNCNTDSSKYEMYSNGISIFAASIISFFFFTKIVEEHQSYKLFPSIIMSVYYTNSLYKIIS